MCEVLCFQFLMILIFHFVFIQDVYRKQIQEKVKKGELRVQPQSKPGLYNIISGKVFGALAHGSRHVVHAGSRLKQNCGLMCRIGHLTLIAFIELQFMHNQSFVLCAYSESRKIIDYHVC